MRGYFGQERNPKTGRRPLVFSIKKAWSGVPLPIPCGKCFDCQLDWSRQWAIRCMNEKRLHVDSAFLTLTYRDKDLPARGTLVKTDLQLFMKRLRSFRPAGLRFFACGEYGETTRRPHYHVLLFNTCFPDMKPYSRSSISSDQTISEQDLYVSAELDGIWKLGDCKVGHVTAASCAYVGRYVTKKVNGAAAPAHYHGRSKEFHVMSRKPGIGLGYYEKYWREMYQHDSVVFDGREIGIPRYYDTKYAEIDAKHLEQLKRARRRKAKLRVGKQTNRRRVAIERFNILKSETFKRKAI